jgi:hypothetical protein
MTFILLFTHTRRDTTNTCAKSVYRIKITSNKCAGVVGWVTATQNVSNTIKFTHLRVWRVKWTHIQSPVRVASQTQTYAIVGGVVDPKWFQFNSLRAWGVKLVHFQSFASVLRLTNTYPIVHARGDSNSIIFDCVRLNLSYFQSSACVTSQMNTHTIACTRGESNTNICTRLRVCRVNLNLFHKHTKSYTRVASQTQTLLPLCTSSSCRLCALPAPDCTRDTKKKCATDFA